MLCLVVMRALIVCLVPLVLPVHPTLHHWIQHYILYLNYRHRQVDMIVSFLVCDFASIFHVMTFLCYKYKQFRLGRLCHRLAKIHDDFFTILILYHCVVWVARLCSTLLMRRSLHMIHIYTLSTFVLFGRDSWCVLLRKQLRDGLRKHGVVEKGGFRE